MSKRTSYPFMLVFCLVAMLAPLLMAANPLPAGSGGKQIVFMISDSNLRLTYVKISGSNQNWKAAVWEKRAARGMHLAYTKNWWWVEDSTRISFAYVNQRTQQSVSASCIFDSLAQPSGDYVYIVYEPQKGCVGGEAGSASSSVQRSLSPVKNAFNTIGYYLEDFDEEVFIDTFAETFETNLKAELCVLAVAHSLQTYGGSIALAEMALDESCGSVAEDLLEAVFIE